MNQFCYFNRHQVGGGEGAVIFKDLQETKKWQQGSDLYEHKKAKLMCNVEVLFTAASACCSTPEDVNPDSKFPHFHLGFLPITELWVHVTF